MTRGMGILGTCAVAIVTGFLATGAAHAQQQNGMDLSPAKSNCGPDFKTCANYSTGDVTAANPSAAQKNAVDPQGPGSDLSPAKSNCGSDFKTCADYSTGDVTKVNPQSK